MGPQRSIHFVGVGGVGTGSLAVALAQNGFRVTGSDQALYEPMRSVLAASKIELTEGYRAETAERLDVDEVMIGNVVRRDNPEVKAWLKKGTPFLSFPAAVRKYVIQEKVSVVVAGTHGKTTTTTWIAYLLSQLGMDPSYLIGGVPRDLETGCKVTVGNIFVGEGDEYDSAFFDKGPKFLHYNPTYLVLNNIEFDHADIYRDLAHVQTSFEKLVALVPGTGLVFARYEDPVVMEVAQGALCPVQTFGLSPGALWRVGKVEYDGAYSVFEVLYKNRSMGTFRTRLFGDFNYLNLVSGIACAINLGNSVDKIRPIVEKFQGARRRQEFLQDDPFYVIDDFAHHPTEVKATLKAVRYRFPEKKIWALFEPRSATARRNVHQGEYENAFDGADQILISSPFRSGELAADERFSPEILVQALTAKGKSARSFENVDQILEVVRTGVSPGDVVLIMSNGEFGKIQSRLVSKLP